MLKSPPHTARIRLLLEIFPEARFVHVHRHPYAVFQSTMHMLESIWPYWNIQTAGKHATPEARIDRVLSTYRLMYDAFFEQRHLIPAGHFFELSYEELERDPTGSLRGLYSALNLPGIEQQVVAMQDYLKARRRLSQEQPYADQRSDAPASGASLGNSLRRVGISQMRRMATSAPLREAATALAA